MKKLLALIAALLVPVFAFAQNINNIQSLGDTVINIINQVAVPLIFALAFIVFIWGVFNYFILGGGDEEKRDKGRDLMIWGLIGFFIMVSVWGLVNLLVGTFVFSDKTPPNFPDADLRNPPGNN